jgi:hypothetical protein
MNSFTWDWSPLKMSILQDFTSGFLEVVQTSFCLAGNTFKNTFLFKGNNSANRKTHVIHKYLNYRSIIVKYIDWFKKSSQDKL